MRKPTSKNLRNQQRFSEVQEVELLESWIEFGKPDSGLNPLSLSPLPKEGPIGRIDESSFSNYAACTRFYQLPLSRKTKDGLSESKYIEMTEIQRASLPHSLCGRDILGAAKTGSGKTLAFIIPVLEKLYRARWGPEDGVGSIIISPTRELAGELFDVLRNVGRNHSFSAGLLIGGRKDVDTEKEHVNNLNILVCTPGRLLQHMDETPNFDCSQLQVLVLDEADRILDAGFKKTLNSILSQLPKRRQTLLFSATQTKSVQDLARLSLKDPEYISVHEESVTATPSRLQQTAMIVPLDQKINMLWSFIKMHLNSKILVFLSSCKQVKFVFEAFKKLRPGIPLKCLHGRMKQERRMGIYSQFCETRSVLFATDVGSRGLNFNNAVDWVVQVDCPENVASYIHRVGRTARYHSGGKSVLFLLPSETEMLKKLQEAKIPIKLIKANSKRLLSVTNALSELLVKSPDTQYLAQRAFTTYLRSIYKQQDKEVFDVMNLPLEDFSASLGLPVTPKVRFLNQKIKGKKLPEEEGPLLQRGNIDKDEVVTVRRKKSHVDDLEEEVERDFLSAKEAAVDGEANEDSIPATRILKKKKLKINVHRPIGTRVVFDEEGNTLPPLAALADTASADGLLQLDKVKERYEKLKEEMKQRDKEDKQLLRQRLREKRTKEKMKLTRARQEQEVASEHEEDMSGSDGETIDNKSRKRSKIYFESESDDDEKKGKKDNVGFSEDSISLEEQEALALKLLSSMHS
ncbi:DEAD-box ATP-dependent RNA helicase 32 [Macadamia integrifolia]|uniref:DEAD-box ATP-dependent RNA helicase 32 n=1 Tax=Macadamia integrifolia TaxID=60698 RepID=UPI001C4E6BA4|nr:DEAD-box ATP-dependent RNA helicase 32 [Macadamia integrifolia]